MKTLVFDTETTDLVSNSVIPIEKQPKIIELYMIHLVDNVLSTNGELVGHEHFMFNPGVKISEIVTSITGIKNEDVVNSYRFFEHATHIKNQIESADEVVAHNLAFDKSVVDSEMKRCNLVVKWPRLICTVEATEFLKGYRLKLMDLYEYLFGEKFQGAHRAEQDTTALARCFQELRNREIV